MDVVEKYMNAFTNTRGGKLYLGVRDNGRVCGVHLSMAERDHFRRSVDQCVRAMQPTLTFGLVTATFVPVVGGAAQLFVGVVRVKRIANDPHVHFTRKNQAWGRDNGGVHELIGPELAQLVSDRALAAHRRRAHLKKHGSSSSSDYSSASSRRRPRSNPPAAHWARPTRADGACSAASAPAMWQPHARR